MGPFRMFFGFSLAVMLFFFVAKFFVFAFIAAGVLSIIYAMFRRIKYFITYDRNGEYYFQKYKRNSRYLHSREDQPEPLFYGDRPSQYQNYEDMRFIDIH